MQKETINFDVPRLTGKAIAKNRDPRKLIPFIIAALLFSFSLVIHFAIILKTLDIIEKDGSAILLSALVGDYKISEPATPEKPDESYLKSEEKEAENYDFTLLDRNLSANAENGLALTNETSYTPDLYELLGTETAAGSQGSGEGPLVLIYHTHATEGYADTAKTGFRTNDNKRNIIAVGQVAKEVLEKAGIGTVHLTEQFDRENWSRAYDNSNEAVKKTLKENPTIRYVIDMHRDCIGNEEDGYIRATTKIQGKDTAQLMLVCGTDEGGSGHTKWRQNLAFCVQLQSAIHKKYPSVMRPINLRRASFYQDTSPQALILECGTCAGTLDEARRGAIIFFTSLADYIKGAPSGLDTDELMSALCP